MKINTKYVSVLTYVLALVLTSTSCSLSRHKATAERAVTKFHDQLNVGEYHDIYAQSADGFKQGTSEADTVALFEAVHRKLGLVKQATLTSWRVNTTPAGTMTILTYNVDFTEGKGLEQFAFQVSGDTARLYNYNVNSPLLITK